MNDMRKLMETLDAIERGEILEEGPKDWAKAGIAAAALAGSPQGAEADTLIPDTMPPDIPQVQDVLDYDFDGDTTEMVAPTDPTTGYLATHPNLSPSEAGQQMYDEMRGGFAYSVWEKDGKNVRAGLAMSNDENAVFALGNNNGDIVFMLLPAGGGLKMISPEVEISFGGWFDSHDVTVTSENGEYEIPATKELLRAILDGDEMTITYETVGGEDSLTFGLKGADKVVQKILGG